MTLVPLWQGNLIIPSFKESSFKIGKNFIERILVQECIDEVVVYQSEYLGYLLIKTNLTYPFDRIYIRKRGSKKNQVLSSPILLSYTKNPIDDLNKGIPFKWEVLPEGILAKKTPNEIVDSWNGKFNLINENGASGLRPLQLGALHSISAYLCARDFSEPATVVMPTGTGKTETMMATVVFQKLEKNLVLVPSDALRNQLSKKFLNFGVLTQIGLLPFNIDRPLVSTIKKSVRNLIEAKELIENSNIIIATPNILDKSNEKAFEYICENCNTLLIDEAHHSPAGTWNKVRKRFENKKIFQFTATPFRNDEKEIGGRIIFNYRLGLAQDDGYYKSIRFYPVEEFGEFFKCDQVIAKKAIEILRKDLNDSELKNVHSILPASKNIERAKTVELIYKALGAEFNPVVIHSKKTKNEIDFCIEEIQSRRSKILICVDMLGEGFDFPELKIAAIHDYHKSLAITLQFIGRFTRFKPNVGDAAVIINIADPNVESGLEKLYAADADWDIIIKRLSEEKIEREIKLQKLIDNLKTNGSLAKQISLRSLRPTFTAKIYKTSCKDWYPLSYKEVLPENNNYYHSISVEPKLFILLGIVENDVKWSRYQEINDIVHKLLIAYWNESESSLFVYSNDYLGIKAEKIVSRIFDDKVEMVNGPQVFNILNNVELPLTKNLGSSRSGVISFTQYFGPNVTEGLSDIEKKQANLSNIACLGYENGEKVLWGAAQKKGKIWSYTGGTIEDWMNWCDSIWKKINAPMSEDNITRNFYDQRK
ncbi:MAG: DEAD/DEAH box helicase [Bacteroidales bacterium]